MSEFLSYFKVGYLHITDLAGFDHILFIAALAAIYSIKNWKNVLILITAFTLGHSVTLALSSLGIVNVDANLIEFIIPITILAAAVSNFFYKFPNGIVNEKSANIAIRYGLALFFGLIHGLAFSNYLKSLLGQESNILKPLFSFNLGIELGQIIIVALILALNFLMVQNLGVKRKVWNYIFSGMVFGMAFMLFIESL